MPARRIVDHVAKAGQNRERAIRHLGMKTTRMVGGCDDCVSVARDDR